jgi:hypothetical protein
MNRLLLTAVALIVVGSLAYTPALTQETKATKTGEAKAAKSAAPKSAAPKLDKDGRPLSPKSAAERTALCKADCTPNNYKQSGIGIHGIYRSYAEWDPHLVSPEGKRQFAECVKKCVDPLPAIYVQRAVFAAGLGWFGKSKESCLDCHAKGH